MQEHGPDSYGYGHRFVWHDRQSFCESAAAGKWPSCPCLSLWHCPRQTLRTGSLNPSPSGHTIRSISAADHTHRICSTHVSGSCRTGGQGAGGQGKDKEAVAVAVVGAGAGVRGTGPGTVRLALGLGRWGRSERGCVGAGHWASATGHNLGSYPSKVPGRMRR